MKIRLLFLIVLLAALSFYSENSLAADKKCPESGKTKEGGCQNQCGKSLGASCGDCAGQLCSTKMEGVKEKYPDWILSSSNEVYISDSLIAFRKINGRFPKDVGELIDSGLLLAWPANPETGKPMKLVKSISPKTEDFGKIAYVRKSDSEANFQIVINVDSKPTVYKFPCCKTVSAELEGINGKTSVPTQVRKETFERCLTGIINTGLMRNEFRTGSKKPVTASDLFTKNCFLIKQNLKPDFISGSSQKPFFLEKGIATFKGNPVKFEKCTTSFQENGKAMTDTFFWVAPLKESEDSWYGDESVWNNLQSKVYFYSTEQALKGSLNYPANILISKNDILNGK
jgi:hypothetical protein